MATVVHVEVFRLGSESLVIELESQNTACEIKILAAQHWQEPLACITLLKDTELLSDSTCLIDICEPGSCMLVLMCVLLPSAAWLDELSERLQSSTATNSDRMTALRRLRMGMPSADVGVTKALSTLLNHRRADVVQAAAECIERTAWDENDELTDFMVLLLNHRADVVRTAVVTALAKVSARGHEVALGALIRCWDDHKMYDYRRRPRLLRTISELTTIGNSCAIDLLEKEQFRDCNAFLVLQHILPDGDERVGEWLRVACRQGNMKMYIEGLPHAPIRCRKRRDVVLTEFVASALDFCASGDLKLAALAAFVHFDQSLPDRLVELAGALHDDGEKRVRVAVLRALAAATQRGHHRAIAATQSFVNDRDDGVRARALQLLERAAAAGGA